MGHHALCAWVMLTDLHLAQEKLTHSGMRNPHAA